MTKRRAPRGIAGRSRRCVPDFDSERRSTHTGGLDSTHADRGRDAERPGDIPASGWRDILIRVKRRCAEDRLSIVAAGVAFYALITAFPAVTVLLSVYGLVAHPNDIPRALSPLGDDLSPLGLNLLEAALRSIAASGGHRLGVGIGFGALLTVWGASLGIRKLMEALNLAYGEKEARRFVWRMGLALLLTAGALLVAVVLVAAVVLVPAVAATWSLDPTARQVLLYARWPLSAAMFWGSLVVMYRYGPSRAHPRWSWVGLGAFVATALWLCGSALLSGYVSHFDDFGKAYGSVGLVMILLFWCLLSAFAVLLGAEINAELERQTGADTTVGAAKPIGQRGAAVADSVGASP